MARIFLVDGDERRRRELRDLLRGRGHAVDDYTDLEAAARPLRKRPPGMLLVAAGQHAPSEAEALLSQGTLLAWMGAPEQGPGPSGQPFLPLPPTGPALASLLKRIPEDRAGWSGPGFLKTVDGDIQRFPPIRVMFLAYRVEATGRLVVETPEEGWSVDLVGGDVVGCRGIADLLQSLPVFGVPDDDLGTALGRAIGMGFAPDQVLLAASAGIGRTLARMSLARNGRVRFLDGERPEGQPLVLPSSVPRMIAGGLREVRPVPSLRRSLGGRRADRPIIRRPEDSLEHRWGLSAAVLRMVRAGARVETLGELLATPRGGESDESWYAADLLMQLGLMELEEAMEVSVEHEAVSDPAVDEAVAAPITAEPVAAEPVAAEPVAAESAVEGAALADPDDVVAVELLQAFGRMSTVAPWEVLGVENSRQASVGAVNRLFMDVSAEYHPDRYADASPEALRLAERCFALVTEAHEALLEEGVIEELAERLDAQEQGRPYADRQARASARLTARQGEAAFKKHDWKLAYELYDEAREVDPTEWRYEFKALQAGWRAGAVDAETAVEGLLALTGPRHRERANIVFLTGEILLRDAQEERAYKQFERAVELDPDNVGARRYLRLRDMRQRGDKGSQGGGLGGLFRRRKGS